MDAITRRQLLLQLSAAAAAPWPAFAQGFPSKPVIVKVAFPPGGPADASIRAAGIVVQRSLGQPLLSDNMPGANGSIAAMAVARSEADGHLLLGTTGTDFLVAPLTIATAKYQPDSFRLLGVVGISDFVLVSSPSHQFRTVDDLIAQAKKGGRELSFAHWGPGSAPHLVGGDFQVRTGVKFLEVPYKGAAPTLTDVGGGQVDLTFVPLGGPTLGLIQQGKLRAVGLASSRRNPVLPDLPTLGEHPALKDFEHSLWSALLAPPKTPEPAVARLTAAMNEWSTSPENAARIATNASRRLEPMTLAQNAAFLKAEHQKYMQLARSLKLQAE